MADEPLVIETGVHAPDATVIWLHGLGADGHDFEPIIPELRLDPGINIRFVFPHAPMMPVTINQGFVMRAWFDIRRYYPIAASKSSIAIYSLVTMTSGEIGEDVPEYMQYSIGGANSVRGWDLGSRIGKNQFQLEFVG